MKGATAGGENYTDSGDHVIIAACQELQDAIKIKRVNDELFDHLIAALRWIVHYVRKHNLPLPETDKILRLLDRAEEIEDKLPASVKDPME